MLYPPLGGDALVKGVLHLPHLRHRVGQLQEGLGGAPPRHHHVDVGRPRPQDFQELLQGNPAVAQGVGGLVQDHQVVGPGEEDLLGPPPPLLGQGGGAGEVPAPPGEPVPQAFYGDA